MEELYPDRKAKKTSTQGITLAALAGDKGLPLELLRKFAEKIPGKPVLRIPYKL
jgi:hypothetical protein